MTESPRPRGVTVKVLDLSSLEGDALAYRQQTHPHAVAANAYGGPWAIAEVNGTLYAICQEGVGPEHGVTDEDPLVIDFHANYSDPDGDPHKSSFDMVPFAQATLKPADLLAFPVQAEVDLADFVREFGARLERNFGLWFRLLGGVRV